MRVLLDTHALLWWLAGDARLSRDAKRVIAKSGNDVFVSAASAWEVTTKHRIGKLPSPGPLATDFAGAIAAQGFIPLDITIHHAQRAGSMRGPHADPFDRVLIAQSHAEDLPLVSNEELFDQYEVTRIW
jgi:PIN domain nuclease of toxin-antitoxin system